MLYLYIPQLTFFITVYTLNQEFYLPMHLFGSLESKSHNLMLPDIITVYVTFNTIHNASTFSYLLFYHVIAAQRKKQIFGPFTEGLKALS